MEIVDAQLILTALHRDLPQANGNLVAVERQLRSVRDGAGQIVAARINTSSMQDLQGLANAAMEDCDRVRARLTAIHAIIGRQLPGSTTR